MSPQDDASACEDRALRASPSIILLSRLLLLLMLLVLLLVLLLIPPLTRAEARGKDVPAGPLTTKACTLAFAVEVVVKARAAQRQQQQ